MRPGNGGIINSGSPRSLRAGLSARSSPESSRLAACCLNSRALALLTRRDHAQRPRGNGSHRFLLLFRREILDELAIRFFQLGIRIELFCDARADALASLDLVNVL